MMAASVDSANDRQAPATTSTLWAIGTDGFLYMRLWKNCNFVSCWTNIGFIGKDLYGFAVQESQHGTKILGI